MRGSLTRLAKGEKAGVTRTEDIVGDFDTDPREGRGFHIFGKPIDPNATVRVWSTSRVATVEKTDAGFKFTTESGSTYQLEVLPEAEA